MVETYFTASNEDSPPSPEINANWFSKLTFWWANGLLKKGYRQALAEEDLYSIPSLININNIPCDLTINWAEKWPVGRAIIRRFVKKFWWLSLIHLMNVILTCINPLLVMVLIRCVQSGSTKISDHFLFTNVWQVVVSIFVCGGLNVTFKEQFYWWGLKVGLNFRSMAMAMVYKKSLIITLSNKKNGSTGAITNLMASDSTAILEFIWTSITYTVTIPLLLLILLLLAVYVIGPAGLVGFVPLVSAIPIQGFIASKVTKLREASREKNDQRVNLLSEILQGIRVIKLYGWEVPFKDIIQSIRDSQLGSLIASLQVETWGFFTGTVMSGLGLAAVFVVYVYKGHTLTVDIAFTTLTLYQSMFEPLRSVQAVINDWSRFIVSVKYMDSFLRGEELPKSGRASIANNIKIDDGTFLWDSVNESPGLHYKKSEKSMFASEGGYSTIEMSESNSIGLPEEKPALNGVNFEAPAGKLTCIVGPVGCGKSALLLSILGELQLKSGELYAPSDLAYTPQTPWLITATLRENILFGRPMDQKHYNDTLVACALVKDLPLLPSGDLTEIGEKGINLSGGQKQRVSLARALYANSMCYLLDEPLSAVDMHVAKWLFEQCILGKMANTTRVLVTHQIQFLARADLVVVMNESQITHAGTYTELLAKGINFEEIISKKAIEGEQKEQTKKDEDTEKENEGHDHHIVKSHEVCIILKKEKQLLSIIKDKPGIIAEEDRQIGQVKWEIYKEYFSSAGQLWLLILTLVVYVLIEVAITTANYWLSMWTENKIQKTTTFYVLGYLGIILSYGTLTRVGLQCILSLTFKAATSLHNRMLNVVFAAKASFFDMTPSGRVLNRFSKDQDALDQKLLLIIHEVLECFIITIASIGSICIVSPAMIPPVIILFQRYYRCSIRELKRMSSISYSGIFSVSSETLAGLSVVRAFKNESKFTSVFHNKVNNNTKMLYNEFCVNRWLDVQLEWMSVTVAFLASGISIFMMDSLGTGMVAFIVTTALSACGSLTWGVRQYSQLEVQMSSVERILHYCKNIPLEPIPTFPPPSSSWPERGGIEIKDVVVKYREDLDPVLRGVSCSIKPGEKIGVVGRTGAGKSTLTSAIFKMVEIHEGSICIDNVNIANVGNNILRSRLSIIPQDPVVFSGSIKMNLDPFGNHSDKELWEVLDRVHLKQHVMQLPEKLDFKFKDNGEGFSVGQRQLLCIGRAIIRQAKILVMDEATASLDFNTDALIKQTVRECFASNTLITIAHRLDTIMDSDRIMVFEQGKLIEFDTPSNLMGNPNSKFALLVAAAQKSFNNYGK